MTTRARGIPVGMKALAALLFAALLFVGMPVAAAHATATISLSVDVTSRLGTSLPGLNVYAYPVANHAAIGAGTQATPYSATGYRFDNLIAGQQYAIYFDAPVSATTAFDQFWGGSTWIEDAAYRSWSVDSSLEVSLATNSTITGKVTGVSNRVVGGVTVYPWRYDGSRWYRLPRAAAVTASTGVYTMRNLEPGSYVLEFSIPNTTGYLSEFSGNASDADHATPVTLGLGATVGYSAALVAGGTISGSVSLTQDGHAVLPSDIVAYAYPVLGSGAIDTEHVYVGTPTTTAGRWSVYGLPTGDYKVKLYDRFSEFVDKWAANGDTVDQATVFHVVATKTTTSPGVTGLTFFGDVTTLSSLHVGITDANHNPIGPDAVLYLESTDGEDFFFYTDESTPLIGGAYDFLFLPAGDYRAWVEPNDGISQPYIDDFTVVAGANTWSIDLDPVSAFQYSSSATVTPSATVVGTTYTAGHGHTTMDDNSGVEEDVDYTYLWLRNGVPIYGATGPTYTSRGSDVGDQLSVIVRADAFGYAPVFTALTVGTPTSGPAATITGGAFPTIVSPASPLPGSVLTADVGTWSAPGLSYGYEWRRDGVTILGATGRSYTTTVADGGHAISLIVSASRQGYASSSATAGNTVAVGVFAAARLTKAQVVSASTAGQLPGNVRYAVSSGTWYPAATAYQFSWLVDGVPAGTGTTLVCGPTNCPPAAVVEVVVVAQRQGYADASRRILIRQGTALPNVDTAAYTHDATIAGPPLAPGDVAAVGHVISGDLGSYTYPSSAGGVLTRVFQWQRLIGSTWTNIAKATRQSYVVTTTDLNRSLRLRIGTISSLYGMQWEYPVAGVARYRQELVTTHPAGTIAGSNDWGTTKVLQLTGGWGVSAVTQTYQWFSCDQLLAADCSDTSPGNPDWKPVLKATAPSYVPPAAMADHLLLAQVTGLKYGYQPNAFRSGVIAITSDAPDEVTYLPGATPAVAAGLVGGNAAVGRTLTGKIGTADQPVTRTAQWQICDPACADIPGATGLTYTPTGALLTAHPGGGIRFTETISRVGGTGSATGLSSPAPLVTGTFAALRAPVISGTTTFTATPGTWPADPTLAVSYAWYDGATATGDTGTAFTPSTTGTPVWVRVTAHREGYQDVVVTLVARKGVLAPGPQTLAGAHYGDTLQLAAAPAVPVTAIAPVIAYQWYLGSKPIKGQTRPTFVPSTAYIGKAIKLRITIISPFYAPYPAYSNVIVFGAHPAATGTPTIVSTPGTFAPGARLTVAPVGYPPASFVYLYLWQRSLDGGTTWVNVTTAASYLLSAADANAQIRVRLGAARTAWVISYLYSAPQAIGYAPALATSGPFVLAATGAPGTASVDTAIIAAPAWNTTGVTTAYQWLRNGVPIPGATSAVIVPTASWFGDELVARVTATKAGYLPVTVTSNAVSVGAGAAAVATSLPVVSPAARMNVQSSVSNGVWNVPGVTFSYAWYLASDTGKVNLLSATDSYTPTTTAPLTVYVEASRTGYATGVTSRTVTVAP